MKVILLSLAIFAGATVAAQAQTKVQAVAPSETTAAPSEIGPSKLSEVVPISYTAEPNRKKIRLRTNARRTEPAVLPAQTETQVTHATKARVEGKLAQNAGASFR